MNADLAYLFTGLALLLAVVLPQVRGHEVVSAPLVLLKVGMLMGLLPLPEGQSASPADNQRLVEHLAELTVIVSLMGVGLALDRPLSRATWRSWATTWRLLGFAMPLCIGAVFLLGVGVLGVGAGAALLLAAALAPTDPVLASDVQVEGPTPFDEEPVDEDDEVRFALTSEAGLNDGLAFPFVYAAIAVLSVGDVGEWGLRWLAWDLLGRVALGAVIGVATGRLLARLAFGSLARLPRLAEAGEPLLAVSAVAVSYGLAEVVGAYGFLAVFSCALALRAAERGHDYHQAMHTSIERLEQLLTLVLLLLLGIALTTTLLADLTLEAAVVAALLVFVVRPVCALLSLRVPLTRGSRAAQKERHGQVRLGDDLAIAFFGVRGMGSLFYLAYAAGEVAVPHLDLLWATLGFTIFLSVVVHGLSAHPALQRLGEVRERAELT